MGTHHRLPKHLWTLYHFISSFGDVWSINGTWTVSAQPWICLSFAHRLWYIVIILCMWHRRSTFKSRGQITCYIMLIVHQLPKTKIGGALGELCSPISTAESTFFSVIFLGALQPNDTIVCISSGPSHCEGVWIWQAIVQRGFHGHLHQCQRQQKREERN